MEVGGEGDYIPIATVTTRMSVSKVNMVLNVHRNHKAY